MLNLEQMITKWVRWFFADTVKERMDLQRFATEFNKAYMKACDSNHSQDWKKAAIYGQLFINTSHKTGYNEKIIQKMEVNDMSDEKLYTDIDGEKCTLYQMVRREPDWAAVRIQVGEEALELLSDLLPDMECRVQALKQLWPGDEVDFINECTRTGGYVNETLKRNEVLLTKIISITKR